MRTRVPRRGAWWLSGLATRPRRSVQTPPWQVAVLTLVGPAGRYAHPLVDKGAGYSAPTRSDSLLGETNRKAMNIGNRMTATAANQPQGDISMPAQ